MSDNQIKAGDVVMLKSGGPRMTVTWVSDGKTYCQWFDGNDAKGTNFQAVQLRAVPDEAPEHPGPIVGSSSQFNG